MTCRHCQAELPSNRRIYCDTRCQDKWRYHNDPKRKAANDRRQAEYRERHGLSPRGEQGRAMAALKHTSCEIPWRDCKECGKRFIAKHRQRTYCAEHSEGNAARRAKVLPLTRVDCLECGTVFQQTAHGQKFCSLSHATTHHRRASKRRRKAAKMAIAHEPYTIIEIATRDGHRCGICKQRVPMRMAVPHPKAPTIDHILPLAEGGDDTKANVQLAHFECNWQKAAHAHPTDQLMMVG